MRRRSATGAGSTDVSFEGHANLACAAAARRCPSGGHSAQPHPRRSIAAKYDRADRRIAPVQKRPDTRPSKANALSRAVLWLIAAVLLLDAGYGAWLRYGPHRPHRSTAVQPARPQPAQ